MAAYNEKFVDLGAPKRIWAVASINGDLERLVTVHDHLATRFAIRDRLVYLGNYLGIQSNNNKEIIEELLAFRSALLAKPGMKPCDIVHLRGPAEEAWQRLLRLQFAPMPSNAVNKLHEAGVDSYLRLYNVSLNDTKIIARAGSIAITRWTNNLRDMQRKAAGHDALMSSTRRAAFTQINEKTQQQVLFVPAGFDCSKSLNEQGEALWDSLISFDAPYDGPYSRVVRGFDADRMGVNLEGTAVTLDGGCGYGGQLICGCFDETGAILEVVAVGGKGDIETAYGEDRRARLPEFSSSSPYMEDVKNQPDAYKIASA